uniref:Secreted protein n=1 Tax=Heterorhabditis bacteriophora TaxID=37862 RepID=A0A1I7WE88_HETBA
MTLNLLKLDVTILILACIIKFTNLLEIEECHTSQISTDLCGIFYFKSVNSATVTIYNITEKKYKVIVILAVFNSINERSHKRFFSTNSSIVICWLMIL